MNTKLLMTTSSFTLGLAGMLALFVPDSLLAGLNAPIATRSLLPIQLMGALYFSFALMNWTARGGIIGGIYARPISLANFCHFLAGTLLLAKYQLSNDLNVFVLFALVVYAVFTFLFYWLVFRATGIQAKNLPENR